MDKDQKKRSPNRIIFEYRTHAAYGMVVDENTTLKQKEPDDYGITLRANGELVLKAFYFGWTKPVFTQLVAVNKVLAERVMEMQETILELIKDVPKSLNNGSLDGSYDIFTFFGKRIEALNISRTNINEIIARNPEYYEEYKDNIDFENRVLDAYDDIAELINFYDHGVQLWISRVDSHPGIVRGHLDVGSVDLDTPVKYIRHRIENGVVVKEYVAPEDWKRLKEEKIREFIDKQEWIFAKTYADRAPHEYVVRHKIKGTDEEFMEIVNYIQEYGITMYFWNRPNKYIFVDGWQYWAMGDEKGEVIVLNRCDLERYKISITWTGK